MLGTIAQAVALSGVLWFLWKYCKQAVLTSPLDNIPGPPRDSFLYGNLKQILHRHAWPVYDALTEAYPGVLRLAGPLGHRILYVFDPVALHSIIVKDQYVFEESRFFIKTSEVTLGPGLLATLGDHHRKQRKLLNPVFSIAHMRHMLPTFYDISHKLQQSIEGRVSGRSGPVEVDILSWMGRVALELIGQSGLGYSFDPLVADSADELGLAVKSFQPLMMQLNIFRRILPYFPDVASPWLRRKIVEMIPNKNVQQLKKNVDLMHERAVAICEEKKRLLAQGDEAFKDKVGEGKDLMSILLRANMAASDEDKLPDEEIVGQVSTFIVAAMDTTSNALSMTFSLLAEHPEVQGKLRKEIMEASNGGLEDIDYDTLVSLPYLDAVCRETLRIHPPITSVFRETRKDAVLPLSQPITGVDGSQVSEILVPKDTTVIVGIYSSNRNKAIWGEDAFEWKPERWLDGLPDTVADAKIPGVYSNLMTFLGGGRACIGFKFSQLEMKVVLCLMLLKFKFEPSGKQIKWNIAGIRFPSVGDSTKPSLPLKLSMYKE
uniref:Cytochrome P450 monooxygenase n=1 Tax=Trametes versicolor TaxID=5325 RepID=A0AA86J4E2_TRAVE|nr:cytochrome P450 monooxygenase [Trametes versicolor]